MCNALFAASSFPTAVQTSFHFNDSTFQPWQVEPRLELWTLPGRQQTINECRKSLSCPMAIERCQSIRRFPKEQRDTVGSQAGLTFPVFARLAVDRGYWSGRFAMLLQLPKGTKQRIATAIVPNAISLFLCCWRTPPFTRRRQGNSQSGNGPSAAWVQPFVRPTVAQSLAIFRFRTFTPKLPPRRTEGRLSLVFWTF